MKCGHYFLVVSILLKNNNKETPKKQLNIPEQIFMIIYLKWKGIMDESGQLYDIILYY
jgi:hypothetical protein